MKYKDQTFIEIAEIMAKNSYAERLKVGAVLVKDDRIIATGYNGTISGFDNKCEDEDNKTKDDVLHAEQNVICFCSKNGLKTNNTALYITHSPCIQCSKLIAQSGIKKVIYKDNYRDDSGIKFLKNYGIEVIKYEEK